MHKKNAEKLRRTVGKQYVEPAKYTKNHSSCKKSSQESYWFQKDSTCCVVFCCFFHLGNLGSSFFVSINFCSSHDKRMYHFLGKPLGMGMPSSTHQCETPGVRQVVTTKANNVEAKDELPSSPDPTPERTDPDPATFRSSHTSKVLEESSGGTEAKQEGRFESGKAVEPPELEVDSKQKAMKDSRGKIREDTEDTNRTDITEKKIKRRSDSQLEEAVVSPALPEMVEPSEPPLKKAPEEEVKLSEDAEKVEKDAQPPEIKEVTTSSTKQLTDGVEGTPPAEIEGEASPSKVAAEIPTAEVSTNLEESKGSDNETAEVSATIEEVSRICMVDLGTQKKQLPPNVSGT